MPKTVAQFGPFFLLLFTTCACDYEHDRVLPGYHGPFTAGDRANPRAAADVASTQGQGATVFVGASTAPTQPAANSGNGGRGGNSGNSVAMGGSMLAAGMPARLTGGRSCDLSGRWLATEHMVTDALGQLQYAHSYLYYEIAQQGDAFQVTKGMQCANDAEGVGDLAVSVDFRKAWPGVMAKLTFQGRAGVSAVAANGCMVALDKWYQVQGASVPHYLDPATPLPTAEEQAVGSTPGWEDWDSDGNPGVTGSITGAITGRVFLAPRSWTSMTGSVPDVSSVFSLPLQWGNEKNVMAYDGSPLLVSDAVRAANASLHFVDFARLADGQATGDDAAICADVIELAPVLTPRAAGL